MKCVKRNLVAIFRKSKQMRTWNSLDLGVKTSWSYKRYQLVDFPSFVNFVELVFWVQVPQPVDTFYQFLEPFSKVVWMVWFMTLGIFGILIYFVTMLTKFQNPNKLEHVKFLDYLLYSSGLTIQPLIDHQWINFVRSKTNRSS